MNSQEQLIVRPIGIVHSPHQQVAHMPIQPLAAENFQGQIEVFDEYVAGLKDLEGFSHITLIYRFHKVNGFALQVVPFMDVEERGIFATRSPKRPNQIGLSTVRILGIHGHLIDIDQVDILDGTPVLDIKPFYPRYDNRENVKIGWLEKNKDLPIEQLKSDHRFE